MSFSVPEGGQRQPMIWYVTVNSATRTFSGLVEGGAARFLKPTTTSHTYCKEPQVGVVTLAAVFYPNSTPPAEWVYSAPP